jgi:hypothetical protein
MSTAISIVYYFTIELPGVALRTMTDCLGKWWYSHYH